ncbi:MAG TPA: dienelactone hydrolase family protein [Puia sp.]|nr:dienelactone hydrolase family protein [Puia sp.]
METKLHLQVMIPAGNQKLSAELTIPANAGAIIIFARAAADSHLNRRDRTMAMRLNEAGFGTLLPDLLTEKEMLASREFDIDLLTARLLIVTKWLQHRDLFGHYRLAYYGVTFGAAAAIQAAVCLDDSIFAIVCRAGRVDLATEALPELQAPTLFLVGSLDRPVLQLNRDALESLSCPRRLEVIQGATHLFSDDKSVEVANLAQGWFERHLQLSITNPQKHVI